MKTYKVDFETNTVVITKAYAEKAQTPNSEAFRMLKEFREMGFSIVNRTHSSPKRQKPTPSFEQMEAYIALLAEADTYRVRYDAILAEAKCHRNPIVRVRKWFNDTFPNYGELPEFDENNKIVITPENHDAKSLRESA